MSRSCSDKAAIRFGDVGNPATWEIRDNSAIRWRSKDIVDTASEVKYFGDAARDLEKSSPLYLPYGLISTSIRKCYVFDLP